MFTSKTIVTGILGLAFLVSIAQLASTYSSKSSFEPNPASIQKENDRDFRGEQPLTMPPYRSPWNGPEIENPEPVPGYPGISVGNNSLIESGWNQIGPTPQPDPEEQAPEEEAPTPAKPSIPEKPSPSTPSASAGTQAGTSIN